MLGSIRKAIVTSLGDIWHGSHDQLSPETEASRIDPPPLPRRPPNNQKRKHSAPYCSSTEHEKNHSSITRKQSRRRSLMSDPPNVFIPPPPNPISKRHSPSKHVHEVGPSAALYALPQQRKSCLPVQISDSFLDDVDQAIDLRHSRSSSPRATNPLARSNTRAHQRQQSQEHLLRPEQD
jgi:hypothetical protein